tara:strand:+ start:97 stop:342 length:246 start_codon:yes stop_codon:yes gene_type:complete
LARKKNYAGERPGEEPNMVRMNEKIFGGEKLGLIRSTLGLPFKAYAIILAPAALICPPVAAIAMSSWFVGAGIAGDGNEDC